MYEEEIPFGKLLLKQIVDLSRQTICLVLKG